MKKRNIIQVSIALIAILLLQLACGKSITNTISSIASQIAPTEGSGETAEVAVATAAPVSSVEKLVMTDYGFGQYETYVGYGFMIQNPNQNAQIVDSEYQVSFYDAGGTVVETDSGYLDFVYPGQTTGVAGEVYLDEGVTVDRVEIQFSDGEAEASDVFEAPSATKEAFAKDEYYTYGVAEIYNPFDVRVSNMRVSAIFLDADSKIIGGGYTYLNFVEPFDVAGTQLTGTSSVDPAQVKIFPNPTSWSFEQDDGIPSDAQPLELVNSGFAQGEYSTGYAVITRNPDTKYEVQDSIFHATFYSADQQVLGYVEGYIPRLMQGETLATATDEYLVLEDQVVDSVVVQVLPGEYVDNGVQPVFTSQNATYKPDSYFPSVTGEIVNPYTQQVTDIEVTAIAYDSAGNIVGTGWTYLDFIPASTASAVEVYMTMSGEPATVELFATLSSFSEFE